MYPSRGNAFGQQLYGGQQPFGQNDQEIAGYRAHASAAAQYGGQYGDVYGTTALSSVQQAGSLSSKVQGSSSLQGRAGYAPGMEESPNFASERRNYGDHQSAYVGRDLQSEAARLYSDSVGLKQPDLYDHIDQASLLRQQQMLKSQALQSTSLDANARQADYLAARDAAIRHATQDLGSYGGRLDVDPRSLSMLSSASYGAQHQASILGAAPRRNVDDLMYAQGSSAAGYGVSLPPGRDYAAGKGLRGTSLETDFPGLSRGAGSRIDERKDDRDGYRRELEARDEERRRDLRDREREREREKDRERERERAREKERLVDRRDRVRERERKRGIEVRRERTPLRATRDRPGSSLGREERSLRRDSPHHESLHRRHSPVREKRREYICKVFPSSLVEVERDYQSISKRYPRLSVSPEFSKVVLNWPKYNLNLSFHTPVSFEHDLVEIESKAEQDLFTDHLLVDQSRIGSTVWNAKVILMNGLSRDAVDDLSSDKSFGDRLPHINNILRFAFLRKDRSFMAIGGPWNAVDGGDPSVDDSSLVQTALRHAKDLVQLDLHSCRNWNRFLEIHYDRVGKDGLFSHREITVLFIPDLSDCLPSLNVWRDQWLAYKKSLIDRERHLALQKEKKSGEKDKAVKGDKNHKKLDKDGDSRKEKKEPQTNDSKKTGEEGASVTKENAAEKQKSKDETEAGENEKDLKKEEEPVAQVTEAQKPGKKKIVRKVVKQKVADKNSDDLGDKQGKADITVGQDVVSVDPAKSSVKRKLVKKGTGKSAQKEDKQTTLDVVPTETDSKTEKVQEDKANDNVDNNAVSVAKGSGAKTVTKKKIIKRVPKKKASGAEDTGATLDSKKDGDKDVSNTEPGKSKEPVVEDDKGKKTASKTDSKIVVAEKPGDGANTGGNAIKDDQSKNGGKVVNDTGDAETKLETDVAKGKGSTKGSDAKKEKPKDDKEKKGKDVKDESRHKSSKDVKEKGKSEEPPKHPGLILRTKWPKEYKLRSTSLSLDSLLDYTDKDIEESTFELSLFAESLYEMLQFQMGCRLLAFLQNLRLHFVKRNQRKRQRGENPKESEKDKSSSKRPRKTAELPVKNESPRARKSDAEKPENEVTVKKENEETVSKDETSADGVDESGDENNENDGDDYDPEEEYVEEDEKMDDASHENDTSKEEVSVEAKSKEEEMSEKKEDERIEDGVENKVEKASDSNSAEKSKDKDAGVEKKEKEKAVVKARIVDKELLQAFMFFDRNRVGYIKVEDLRLIIHNLGKFLSHRDVKELVQSALLESNTARDNRILYHKLVKQ